MSDAVQQELRGFVAELIEQSGGLVDWPADSDRGQAILTPELAQRVGVEELLPLSTRPGGEGQLVSLASDFLDTAELWLQAVPRVGRFQIAEAYLKRGDLSDAVARAYTWLNTKVRLIDSQPTYIEYHTWWFHVVLASEDRWESRLAVTVNCPTAVEVEFPDPLGLWELVPGADESDGGVVSYDAAAAAAQRRVTTMAATFLARLDARLQRDRKRLNDYYHALVREAHQRHQRARSAGAPDQADDSDRAVTLELRRKLAELEERYAIDATLRPLVVIRTQLPALEVRLAVQRKQARRDLVVYWNPLTKAFDPIRCTQCGHGVYSVAFTNDRVDAVCGGCAK
jgi:hypothetical protein